MCAASDLIPGHTSQTIPCLTLLKDHTATSMSSKPDHTHHEHASWLGKTMGSPSTDCNCGPSPSPPQHPAAPGPLWGAQAVEGDAQGHFLCEKRRISDGPFFRTAWSMKQTSIVYKDKNSQPYGFTDLQNIILKNLIHR